MDSAGGSLWGGGGSKFHGGRREKKWEGRRITILWDSSRASAARSPSPAQHDKKVLSGPQLSRADVATAPAGLRTSSQTSPQSTEPANSGEEAQMGSVVRDGRVNTGLMSSFPHKIP